MAITQNTYTGNGSTILYTFSFPYINRAHVKVTINGVTISAYTFVNSTTIQFTTAPASGAVIKIFRDTDNENLSSAFSAGSSIRAQDLNSGFNQILYVSQETENLALSTDSSVIAATATTALNNSVTAIATANAASATATTATTSANTAVTTANTASTAASTANTAANTALASANSAISTANTAATNASTALTTASTASSTATTASTNASAAVTTANTASTNASAALNFTQAGTGVVARSVESKLRDVVSVRDFGAVGDGVTNDTVAVNAAFATNKRVYFPEGNYLTTVVAPRVFNGSSFGPGIIITADGNKTTGWSNKIRFRPTEGNEDSSETAFNGDFSKCPFPVKHYIVGADTLGKPADTYGSVFETTPHFTYLYNESGWNESTGKPFPGQTGRTGAYAYSTFAYNFGQGDLVCYNANAFVGSTKPGCTDWLSSPAAVLFNGQCNAGANNVYLNPYETYCKDYGYDVACVGMVNNFERTNATAAKSEVWLGYRVQTKGTARCDAIFSGTGLWTTGLDFAMANLNFGTTKAAISLKANDRVYFNNTAVTSGTITEDWRTTQFNGDYMEYNSGSGGFINFVRGNSSRLQIGTSSVFVTNANLRVTPNGLGTDTSTISAIRSGFGYPTGTVNTATFSTATVTLPQLAQYVAGLVQAIHASTTGAHALIST